mgnify:CR=1 FL=1
MTRKQKRLLLRIIVATILFISGKVFSVQEPIEIGIFLVCCRMGYHLESDHKYPAWSGF